MRGGPINLVHQGRRRFPLHRLREAAAAQRPDPPMAPLCRCALQPGGLSAPSWLEYQIGARTIAGAPSATSKRSDTTPNAQLFEAPPKADTALLGRAGCLTAPSAPGMVRGGKGFVLRKSKPPLREQRGFGDKNPGDDLLSHGLSHTTIGAAAFHFRVRDGIGWFHSANFTRERVGGSLSGNCMDKAPASRRSCDVACTWVHRHVMSAKAT